MSIINWLSDRGFNATLGLFSIFGSFLNCLKNKEPHKNWSTALGFFLINILSGFLIGAIFGPWFCDLLPASLGSAKYQCGVGSLIGLMSQQIMDFIVKNYIPDFQVLFEKKKKVKRK